MELMGAKDTGFLSVLVTLSLCGYFSEDSDYQYAYESSLVLLGCLVSNHAVLTVVIFLALC